jgi:hypothetical protein
LPFFFLEKIMQISQWCVGLLCVIGLGVAPAPSTASKGGSTYSSGSRPPSGSSPSPSSPRAAPPPKPHNAGSTGADRTSRQFQPQKPAQGPSTRPGSTPPPFDKKQKPGKSAPFGPETAARPALDKKHNKTQKTPPPREAGPVAADKGPVSPTRFSVEELRKTKENWQKNILKGHEDPFRALMANPSSKSIDGPKGSNLVAMVKIRPSAGKRYNQQANQALFEDPALQARLRARFASEQGELQGEFVPPRKEGKNIKNPYIIRPDGTRVPLEWHHSVNHVGSVSLIPKEDHRLGKGGMDRLHYIDPETGKAKGGDALYTVPDHFSSHRGQDQ